MAFLHTDTPIPIAFPEPNLYNNSYILRVGEFQRERGDALEEDCGEDAPPKERATHGFNPTLQHAQPHSILRAQQEEEEHKFRGREIWVRAEKNAPKVLPSPNAAVRSRVNAIKILFVVVRRS